MLDSFDQIDKIDYTKSSRTDHALTYMHLTNNEFRRGPGIWKFNTKLLMNDEFNHKTREKIIATLNKCKNQNVCIFERWECVKKRCTVVTKEYSKREFGSKRILLDNLYQYRDEVLCNPTIKLDTKTEHLIETKIRELEME